MVTGILTKVHARDLDASYFTPRVCQMQTAFRRVPALERFNVNIDAMNYLHVPAELLLRRSTNATNCSQCADDVQFTRTHETLARDLKIVRNCMIVLRFARTLLNV